MFAIYAVHQLTRSREREKSAFDLYKAAAEQIIRVKEVAVSAWALQAGDPRNAAIAELVWRLQSLGATVERLRLLSGRGKWTWRWPFRTTREVLVTKAMADLRDQLTGDPLYEPERTGGEKTAEQVEVAIGDFNLQLDEQFLAWLK